MDYSVVAPPPKSEKEPEKEATPKREGAPPPSPELTQGGPSQPRYCYDYPYMGGPGFGPRPIICTDELSRAREMKSAELIYSKTHRLNFRDDPYYNECYSGAPCRNVPLFNPPPLFRCIQPPPPLPPPPMPPLLPLPYHIHPGPPPPPPPYHIHPGPPPPPYHIHPGPPPQPPGPIREPRPMGYDPYGCGYHPSYGYLSDDNRSGCIVM